MPTKYWNVPINWTMASSYAIEAETKEEALEIAESLPLPTDGEYIGHQLFPDEVEEMPEHLARDVKVWPGGH